MKSPLGCRHFRPKVPISADHPFTPFLSSLFLPLTAFDMESHTITPQLSLLASLSFPGQYPASPLVFERLSRPASC